jgi:hypothetical protein
MPEDAEIALKEAKSKKFKDRKLKLDYAVKKQYRKWK